jgi:hypothetical protein
MSLSSTTTTDAMNRFPGDGNITPVLLRTATMRLTSRIIGIGLMFICLNEKQVRGGDIINWSGGKLYGF